MRVVVTGQVGLDKASFLGHVQDMGAQQGFEIATCHVGQMMYAEAPDVQPGRILDLPLSRLQALRRSVFKDVLRAAEHQPHVIVNTHATFRWRHGLFYAFDYDQMKALDADLYVTIVDNIDTIHARLRRDGHRDHTLKDLMVWREEETLATELLSQIVRGHGHFYILARGLDDPIPNARALVDLMFRPQLPKVYLSFPMSHVMGNADVMAQIERFRREMKRHFICFDPGDVEEKYLCQPALEAVERGLRVMDIGPAEMRVTVDPAEVMGIIPDIDGQIYARDFKLIDQSDMIVSLVPSLADGAPGLSSGVERELQHAHEAAKRVYVIWLARPEPSPFVTATATRVFRSTQEAMDYLLDTHHIPHEPRGGLFGRSVD